MSLRGLLNPFAVYGIVVFGDMIGDSLHYWGGRIGGRFIFPLLQKFAGVTPEQVKRVRTLFEQRRFRMLALSKLIHGVGVAGLVAAGAVGFSWARFVIGCALISLCQSGFLIGLGRVAGWAQNDIGHYLNWYAVGGSMIAIAIGIYLVLSGYVARLFAEALQLNGDER